MNEMRFMETSQPRAQRNRFIIRVSNYDHHARHRLGGALWRSCPAQQIFCRNH